MGNGRHFCLVIAAALLMEMTSDGGSLSVLFEDGFESGDTGGWSHLEPPPTPPMAPPDCSGYP